MATNFDLNQMINMSAAFTEYLFERKVLKSEHKTEFVVTMRNYLESKYASALAEKVETDKKEMKQCENPSQVVQEVKQCENPSQVVQEVEPCENPSDMVVNTKFNSVSDYVLVVFIILLCVLLYLL